MDLAHKQGQDDNGSIREKERLLLRLMMPVAKMFTAKVGIKSFIFWDIIPLILQQFRQTLPYYFEILD